MSGAEQQPKAPTHILWTTTVKRCLGCERVKELFGQYPDDQNSILVQDIKNLHAENVDLPGWLRGTPTLYHIATRNLFEGKNALTELQTVLRSSDSGDTQLAQDDGLAAAAAVGVRGSWEDNEDCDNATAAADTADNFEMEVGCDPDEISDAKVSLSDVEQMMQSRGLDMPKAADPAEQK